VRAELRRLDATLPLAAQRTLQESVTAATITQRLAGTFVSIFGAVALLLAAVGLYGVLQNAVAERAREIGIRVALGGSRRDILRLVTRPALRLSALGIALGLLGAAVLARLVAKILFGVSPLDPATFGSVAVLMLVVALVATVVPAWRATRVDPALALRQE
jgi:ABC-type antimicrobial peptide transport system permease subunit